jgi:SlyX protein
MPPERLDRLEERIAWLEHHVTEQDKAMLGLHEEISRLQRSFIALRSRLAEGGSVTDDGGSAASETSERPPHY